MRWRFEVMKKARTLPRTRRYGGNYEPAGLDASSKDTEHNMVVEDNMDNNELNASQDERNSNADDDTSDTSMEAQLSQEPSNSSSMQFVLEATESNNNNSKS